MPYSKQTWATGDTITAEKLNHIEGGVANSIQLPENAFLIHITYDPDEGSCTPDKTFQEALSAYNNSKAIYAEVDTLGTFYLEPIYDSSFNIIDFRYSQIISINTVKSTISYVTLGINEEDNDTVAYYFTATDTYLCANNPLTNGTYVFKATKTNDGITYSWVAE